MPAASYWSDSRSPRYSLLFALPLLVMYEALAFLLSHDAFAGVRNGADVLLKSIFLTLGGRNGLIVFGMLLVGTGAVMVWKDWRKSGGELRGRVFAGMALESVVYALAFGTVVSLVTGLVLGQGLRLSTQTMERLDLSTQLMISLGAGIYEELLFRVLLVSVLVGLGKLLGWKPLTAAVAATLVGALIFSAFHYIGPYGDPFQLSSFTFRAIAGVFFSAMFLTRGFGITAWTHALYDVILSLR